MTGEAVWRVAIDTGGTFTDAYFFNEATGQSHVAKVSSTPASPEIAVTGKHQGRGRSRLPRSGC